MSDFTENDTMTDASNTNNLDDLKEDKSDELLLKLSKEILNEQPKISTAIKNLISVVLGKSLTDPSTALRFGGGFIFTPDIGIACGKCLLQAIQR